MFRALGTRKCASSAAVGNLLLGAPLAAEINAATRRDAVAFMEKHELHLATPDTSQCNLCAISAHHASRQPRLAMVTVQSLHPTTNAILDALRTHPLQTARELAGVVEFKLVNLPPNTSQSELDNVVSKLSSKPDYHGVSVVRPLPEGVDPHTALEHVLPVKDVDGLHPANIGLFHMRGCMPVHMPCSAEAFMRMLAFYEIDYRSSSKRVVIVGTSNTVGRRIAEALLREGVVAQHFGRPAIEHNDAELRAQMRQADIVVTTCGIAEHFGAEYFKPGCAVFDFGLNPVLEHHQQHQHDHRCHHPHVNAVEDDECDVYRIAGDVKFEEVRQVAGFITPPVLGMYPVTAAVLFENVVRAYRLCVAGHSDNDSLAASSFLWGEKTSERYGVAQESRVLKQAIAALRESTD